MAKRKLPPNAPAGKSTIAKTALFPGTFDPVTFGHIDLVRRAAALFERVLVGVAHNPEKRELLSVDERIELLRRALEGEARVEVRSLEGLVVEAARKAGAQVIVRGVRNSLDFEYESQMARCNARLEPALETVLLAASPEHAHISSTLVRQVVLCGGDPAPFVPAFVAASLLAPRAAWRASRARR